MEPRKFITVLTSARHLFLSWANSIQYPQPLPTSWRSILILSSHLRLGPHSVYVFIYLDFSPLIAHLYTDVSIFRVSFHRLGRTWNGWVPSFPRTPPPCYYYADQSQISLTLSFIKWSRLLSCCVQLDYFNHSVYSVLPKFIWNNSTLFMPF